MLSAVWERASSGWRAPGLLALASTGMLGGALFMQHVVGIQPCVLCLYQRWPYVIAGLLALTALVFGRHRRFRVVLLGLIALVMVVDSGIAAFHVGIEHHWWAGTAGCGVPPPADSIEALRARLLAAPVVRCDEVQWSLLGISLAGCNMVITLELAAFALVAARRAVTPKGHTDVV